MTHFKQLFFGCLLFLHGYVFAEENHGCQHSFAWLRPFVVMENKDSGIEVTAPCVEFLALREGLCREIWVQGNQITEVTDITCPVEELKQYIR